MPRLLALAVLVTAHVARAGTCPPSVVLTGDPTAVRQVRDELDARGISGETPRCPAVHARIERRGSMLVVGIELPPGAPDRAGGVPGPGAAAIERAVSEPATAATVIESWTRSDVAAPLLAIHALQRAGDGEPALVAAPPATPPAAQGIQLFAAEETSVASDGTVWEGMQLGACVMLGPICASARVHGGSVVSRPASWRAFSRKGADVYAGIDVPIAVGWTRLTLGFAAGYGSMFTRHHDADAGEKMGVEISGPRAEVHAALSLPLTAHIALDLVTTGELTQATWTETHGPGAPDPTVVFPDVPRALFRFAIGVRYGAL